MQSETRTLFPEESRRILSNIVTFDKSRLQSVEPVVKTSVVIDENPPNSSNSSQSKSSSNSPQPPQVQPQPSTNMSDKPAPSKGLFSSLLSGISSFNKKELKQTETEVKSLPIIESDLNITRTTPSVRKDSTKNVKRLSASPTEMHGRLGNPDWAAPVLVLESDTLARPGYDNNTKSHEFIDEPEVMRAKAKLLAQLIRKSKKMAAYTGAGISTASGIGDYATHSDKSVTAVVPKLKTPWDARPTLSHRILVAMYQAGHLKHWVQQNHDGLPQKAGFPQEALNEIHGAWYDPSNPVVPMSGDLRGDLFKWLLEWEKKADLVLVLGTSLAGMNADRVVTSCAKRAAQSKAIGSVIVSLQRTQQDSHCSLRFFGTIDQVMRMVAEELEELNFPRVLQEFKEDRLFTPTVQPEHKVAEQEDVFLIPYDAQGKPLPQGVPPVVLDLREDQKVRITAGPHTGDWGVVMGKNSEGHYRIQFRHEIGKKKPDQKSFKAPMIRILGNWFVESGTKGSLPIFPVVSASDEVED